MKKNILRLLLFLLLMLAFCLPSVAEDLGNLPDRGLILPFTQADADMGLSVSSIIAQTPQVSELPLVMIGYTDAVGMEETLAGYSDEDLNNPDMYYEIIVALSAHMHTLCEVALFETELYNTAAAEGYELFVLNSGEESFVMGENGGYTYVAICANIATEDSALAERLAAASARAKELLHSAAFQEIALPESSSAQSGDAFPAFSTVDLNGNPVTSSIFSQKDLTVVNVWATWCNPCTSEMPELQAWSESMPENVQIIGLTSDLNSIEDAEMLETAKMIAEETGVTYPLLVVNEELYPFVYSVVGFPTTFFVDSTGAFAAEPIVGADVPACMEIVNTYLATMN